MQADPVRRQVGSPCCWLPAAPSTPHPPTSCGAARGRAWPGPWAGMQPPTSCGARQGRGGGAAARPPTSCGAAQARSPTHSPPPSTRAARQQPPCSRTGVPPPRCMAGAAHPPPAAPNLAAPSRRRGPPWPPCWPPPWRLGAPRRPSASGTRPARSSPAARPQRGCQQAVDGPRGSLGGVGARNGTTHHLSAHRIGSMELQAPPAVAAGLRAAPWPRNGGAEGQQHLWSPRLSTWVALLAAPPQIARPGSPPHCSAPPAAPPCPPGRAWAPPAPRLTAWSTPRRQPPTAQPCNSACWPAGSSRTRPQQQGSCGSSWRSRRCGPQQQGSCGSFWRRRPAARRRLPAPPLQPRLCHPRRPAAAGPAGAARRSRRAGARRGGRRPEPQAGGGGGDGARAGPRQPRARPAAAAQAGVPEGHESPSSRLAWKG